MTHHIATQVHPARSSHQLQLRRSCQVVACTRCRPKRPRRGRRDAIVWVREACHGGRAHGRWSRPVGGKQCRDDGAYECRLVFLVIYVCVCVCIQWEGLEHPVGMTPWVAVDSLIFMLTTSVQCNVTSFVVRHTPACTTHTPLAGAQLVY